uniref:Protein MMS22-like n=1 Tax=Timema cristinae TaxID=61476 RepID=A0A7R9CMA6_TIMCR|nr:unnamed protein product [Timema cristinae]
MKPFERLTNNARPHGSVHRYWCIYRGGCRHTSKMSVVATIMLSCRHRVHPPRKITWNFSYTNIGANTDIIDQTFTPFDCLSICDESRLDVHDNVYTSPKICNLMLEQGNEKQTIAGLYDALLLCHCLEDSCQPFHQHVFNSCRLCLFDKSVCDVNSVLPFYAEWVTSIENGLTPLENFKDFVSLGNTNAPTSFYHQFHMNLDLRWYVLTVKYQIFDYIQKHGHTRVSSCIKPKLCYEAYKADILETYFLVFLCELVQLSIYLFEKNKEIFLPITCPASNPGGFSLWFFCNVTLLDGYTSSGEFLGISSPRFVSNYPHLNVIFTKCLSSDISTEEQLRVYLQLLKPILTHWYELNSLPFMKLWDYFQSRLNSFFLVPTESLEALALMRVSMKLENPEICLAEKLQEYLGMLHLEKLSLARQNVVWKAHLALVLLHISKGKDIKEVAQPLVSLVHCHTNDTALMKLFVKDLQHIFELNPTLELSRHVLFVLTMQYNDDEVVLQLMMELCLNHILKEAVREVTRVQPHLAFGLLNELLKSPSIDRNKQIRETFLSALVGLYSHMAFSSQPLFQLLTKLARKYPKLIACTLPDLQREIKTVELSRGVAFDQSLRVASSVVYHPDPSVYSKIYQAADEEGGELSFWRRRSSFLLPERRFRAGTP